MDVSGEHQLDVLHSIYKQRLSPDGQPINEEPEQIKLGTESKETGDDKKDEAAKQEEAKQQEEAKKEKEEHQKNAVGKRECGRSV